MNFINLTPHAITLVDGVVFNPTTKHYEGESRVVREIQPSGVVARCTVAEKELGYLDGIPVISTEYGEVYDLPEPQDGVTYIVSLLVAQACKGKRDDLVIPARLVRDDKGRIIGCTAFAVV